MYGQIIHGGAVSVCSTDRDAYACVCCVHVVEGWAVHAWDKHTHSPQASVVFIIIIIIIQVLQH